MKPVNEIYSEFLLGKVSFHTKEQTDMFRDALMSYIDSKYVTAANLYAILYERIFTTRLVRETSQPFNFVPSKENVTEQLNNLMNRENEVVNVKKLFFRAITQELVETGVLSAKEKTDFDNFYTDIRNPVIHGLTFRLFEPMLGRVPNHIFDLDVNYPAVYKKASEILFDKIYYLMAIKILRKL